MNISWVSLLEHNDVINKGYSKKAAGSLSFSEILSNQTKAISTATEHQMGNCFPNMKVYVKTGKCAISKSNWDRNNFPVWNYFKDNTKADCLNSWTPTGPEPRATDWCVQKELKQIAFGAISILIPTSLQQKMDADPVYAGHIWEKISDWKNSYDQVDNALAASYGYNPSLHQMSKSYCLQLDENGNIEKHVVISGGLGEPYCKEGGKEISIHKSAPKYLGSFPISSKISHKEALENTFEQKAVKLDYSQIAAYIIPQDRKRLWWQ
ncbi:hypothetical protein [Desulfitobacterium chlororespirans]|uniref:Uncharacterized protein n=1 Tax=Desulfitobacterium chlororespirans DSM 11544 TaxID=1121395 RepID=A0A1M7ULW1_9FIRM|nr:hypothetical protein [Desulfitobacterium chlororespirans]SHN84012.1 hypothetical protein SAMN02745215_04134 [Desulfitobacterium chlororespirans DSM 11544]